ncbi:hypothetical protein [Pseudomonas sp. MWU13-2105]|uniref:hypothetical protein n=1 Tax=Pseudomonas sp. MWU13-2105 TaxID=2935074 RepID=UPI00200BFFFB|nr:hypothetical protein [Pseudomonas sp. MWU13-2105]
MAITILIGTGISSAAYLLSVTQYLRSLNQTLGAVGVMGGPDLWQRMSHAHAMGQPKQLLTGNLLGHGRADHGFTAEQLSQREYLSAGQFSTAVQHYLTQHSCAQLPDSFISKIVKDGPKYVLETFLDGALAGTLRCDRVIVGAGPGAPRPLATEEGNLTEENIRDFAGRVIKGNDFMAPDWTSPLHIRPEETTVAVYGGSATAAWAVELAAIRKMKVISWFTRPGRGNGAWSAETRFSEAFPAGDRNNTVEEDYRDVRHVYKLLRVESVAETTKLRLVFQQSEGAEDIVIVLVDLLIYALGAEHTPDQGIRAILTPSITDNLVAFYDRNLAISSRPSLLAVGTPDRTFMIVGSAMSSAAGFGPTLGVQGEPGRSLRDLTSYKEISSTLPAAARPTEGIAMVMAGIEALNEYVPVKPVRGGRTRTYSAPRFTTSDGALPKGSPNPHFGDTSSHDLDFGWDINFNTSNRTQLAIYIAQTTDLAPFAANLAVALIVFFRTRPESVRGLSDPQVTTIISVANAIYKRLTVLNHDLDAQLLHFDKLWGTDMHVNNCVGYVTTTAEWKSLWRNHGITLA